jgi:hypothetical protein
MKEERWKNKEVKRGGREKVRRKRGIHVRGARKHEL